MKSSYVEGQLSLSHIISKSQGSFAIKIARGADLWYFTLNLESCPVCCKKNSKCFSKDGDGDTMALTFSLGNSYPNRWILF